MQQLKHPFMADSVNIITAYPGKYSREAPHWFVVHASNNPYGEPVATIQFQDGPIKEDHIDGVHNEDLILMVIARLQAFQKGEFACRENDMATTHLEEALMWLARRTHERRQRRVEGTNEE